MFIQSLNLLKTKLIQYFNIVTKLEYLVNICAFINYIYDLRTKTIDY